MGNEQVKDDPIVQESIVRGNVFELIYHIIWPGGLSWSDYDWNLRKGVLHGEDGKEYPINKKETKEHEQICRDTLKVQHYHKNRK